MSLHGVQDPRPDAPALERKRLMDRDDRATLATIVMAAAILVSLGLVAATTLAVMWRLFHAIAFGMVL